MSTAEYAEANREEWTKKGKEVVAEWTRELQGSKKLAEECALELQNDEGQDSSS